MITFLSGSALSNLVCAVVLGACIYAVLNPQVHTRLGGTLILSLIGLLAFASLV